MKAQCMITEEQRTHILEYLDDRRSGELSRLVIIGFLALITTGPAMQILADLLGLPVLFFKPLGLFETTQNGIRGADPVLCLLGLIGWCLFVTYFVLRLRADYQRIFGDKAPLNQFRRGEYSCQSIVTAKVNENPACKHPFRITDPFGEEYLCPKYADWKHAERGKGMIGVILPDGQRFAVADEETVTKTERS